MYYGFAASLVIVSIAAYLTIPLNLGIDMTGGVQAEYDYSGGQMNIDTVKTFVDEVKKNIVYNNTEVINNTHIYKISGEDKFIVEAGFSKLSGISDVEFE